MEQYFRNSIRLLPIEKTTHTNWTFISFSISAFHCAICLPSPPLSNIDSLKFSEYIDILYNILSYPPTWHAIIVRLNKGTKLQIVSQNGDLGIDFSGNCFGHAHSVSRGRRPREPVNSRRGGKKSSGCFEGLLNRVTRLGSNWINFVSATSLCKLGDFSVSMPKSNDLNFLRNKNDYLLTSHEWTLLIYTCF